MKIRDEIRRFAEDEDKECLLWLSYNKYWVSHWHLVANHRFERGFPECEVKRIWSPTKDGRLIYELSLRR